MRFSPPAALKTVSAKASAVYCVRNGAKADCRQAAMAAASQGCALRIAIKESSCPRGGFSFSFALRPLPSAMGHLAFRRPEDGKNIAQADFGGIQYAPSAGTTRSIAAGQRVHRFARAGHLFRPRS